MPRSKKGRISMVSPLVGPVITGSWRGINYLRTKPVMGLEPPSRAQLEQRARFALTMRFIKPISKLLEITFKGTGPGKKGMNNALSYTLKNAVSGSFPNNKLDYSRILISRGDLLNVENPTAKATSGVVIHFSWADNSGLSSAKPSDKMVVMIYCPALNKFIYNIGSTVRASAVEYINATAFRGESVETYIAVLADDSKEVATSVYLGRVVVG